MVGHRFIEDLLDKADKDQFDITVFCEEPRIAYDRVHLSSYFSHHTAEELSLVREGFYEKQGVKVLVVNAPSRSTVLKSDSLQQWPKPVLRQVGDGNGFLSVDPTY